MRKCCVHVLYTIDGGSGVVEYVQYHGVHCKKKMIEAGGEMRWQCVGCHSGHGKSETLRRERGHVVVQGHETSTEYSVANN